MNNFLQSSIPLLFKANLLNRNFKWKSHFQEFLLTVANERRTRPHFSEKYRRYLWFEGMKMILQPHYCGSAENFECISFTSKLPSLEKSYQYQLTFIRTKNQIKIVYAGRMTEFIEFFSMKCAHAQRYFCFFNSNWNSFSISITIAASCQQQCIIVFIFQS